MFCRRVVARRIAAVTAIVAAALAATLTIRAELPEWARNVETAGRFYEAVFRTVATPAGPVEVRRTPADAYEALTRMAAGAPDRDLLALRARAAEEKLDAAAAEADWIAFAAASPDRASGQLALADFYHRRLLPQKEAGALAAAAQAPDPESDRLIPSEQRRAWRIFERLFRLIDAERLPDTLAESQLRAWIARFPQEQEPHRRLLRFLLERDRLADAEASIQAFQRAFPYDEAAILRARADVAMHRGADADALAVYAQAFRPLWDAPLVDSYFGLLDRTHGLRAFLQRSRAAAAAHPADLGAVARIFYYYQHSGNVAAAEQALAEYEARRDGATRTADELLTLAQLYEKTRNYNEALRYYAAVYGLPDASAADAERALATIIRTLFTQPEQPLRFGSGDLSFYRDIATLDRYPGFLNGVLSLLFNSVQPQYEYVRQDARAAPYFRRARAVDLLSRFEQRFPRSTWRASLNAMLVSTYAGYGESDAVIERGRRFLDTFADAPQRREVSLLIADAFARKGQVAEEFATYDRLLQEIAERADRVPIGGGGSGSDRTAQSAAARSPEYVRVLDRYIARLVSRRQLADALAVYRREIDRNPGDPGLYAAAAQFLEQNNFTADVEQVYRLAIRQFPDQSWHHRLARWYLRQRQAAAFEKLTRDVTRTFDGTELATYFSGVVQRGPDLNAQLFLQLNLYAHERFPHHLLFVRNLLSAYATRGTADPAAYEALLRHHWFEDERLGNEFFAMLSRTNRLDAELTRVHDIAPPNASLDELARLNPVSARFVAEASIWRSRFESAAPAMTALAAAFPGDIEVARRAGMLHRSLSYADRRELDAAAEAVERIHRFSPRDPAALTTLGEIFADRDRYDRAQSFWNRLTEIEPGNPATYVDAATVFWDYYQFDDALRLLTEGRNAMHNPSLYAYEAGAIYEGLRQGDRAVEEYVRGALAGNASAQTRLLALARRPTFRNAVDRATAVAVTGDRPSVVAVSLRIDVLEAQDRRPDLEQFLSGMLDRTTSQELMEEVGAHADRLGFEALRTRSLMRQIDTMTDPVDRLRLRSALVHLYESRGELALARTAIESLYADYRKILGVVRQTVDYYVRHGLAREGVQVLTRAAADAYPALRKQLLFEAATRSVQAGDYEIGRELLAPLVAGDRFNPDYLATIADSYALARQDQALKDFYTATIEAMRHAPLSEEERTRQVAALRRGLIPALTRLNDFAGAVDQYIEIINRFPDDESLLKEAARYARQHRRADRMVTYYSKTAADSPRDYRWPMLLARLQTEFEDFPAAIDAYARASSVRPDRADFYSARAGLEERLMRFDAAITSYARVYELTYHDRHWMEKVAELRARQGRTADATIALRSALIEGRPETPDLYFAAARRLEQWNMLDAAKSLVDRGVSLAGPDAVLRGGTEYVTVYTRLRQTAAVFDGLLASASTSSLRIDDLTRRLNEMGDVVAREFTPEEKAAFSAFLEQRKPGLAKPELLSAMLTLADHAGLSELAARWRLDQMTATRQLESNPYLSAYVELQTERLRFAELGAELERFAQGGGPSTASARHQAAEAYRKAGDVAGEMRVLSSIPLVNLAEPMLARYFTLLLDRDPQRLVSLAGPANHARIRNAAASFIVEHGTYEQASAAIRERGQGLPPVWTSAYTAIVGFSFGRYDATTTQAFAAVLGPQTIGECLEPADRTVRLAGDTWFEYGSRFGEYLSYASLPRSEEYLSSQIERTPARSEAFVSLADFYRNRGVADSALAEYDHASALNPARSDVHLRAAVLLWRQGQRTAAIERWRHALQLLASQVRASSDPAPIVAALDSIGTRKLLTELREPADTMVRAYLMANGTYRADGLLRAAFRAVNDATGGTDWLLDLARAAPNQMDALAAVANADWFPAAQRDRVIEQIVAVAEAKVGREHGAAQVNAQSELDRWRLERIRRLLDAKQIAAAAGLFNALPDETRRRQPSDVVALEVRIAAGSGTLDALFDRYLRDETWTRSLDTLTSTATILRRAGSAAGARQVMEFVYTRRLEREELIAPVLLGLAELRLQQANLADAMTLLNRLTLAVGEPFEQLAAASGLLERMNHPAESMEFRRARAQAVPWDAEAQIALARVNIAAARDRAGALDLLGRVADAPVFAYASRVEAARAFAAAGGRLSKPARSELELLRSPAELTRANVDRAFFVSARRAAADRVADPNVRVELLSSAVAVDPHDRTLRIPLFRAHLAAGKPGEAVEALQPILRRSRALNNAGLTASERARVARELGEAYARLERLDEAVRMLTIAQEGQTPPVRNALRQRIRTLTDEMKRRAANQARQPRVSEALEQPQLVRPRIVPKPVGAEKAAQGDLQ